MKQRVRLYIEQQQLIARGDRVLLGVSGGADSVCLLYLLYELRSTLGFELYVVHINHGLREEAAKEDEAYVRALCHKLGLHFHAYSIDVANLAQSLGLSIEEAGRKARYDAFLEESMYLQCNKVAVAHHKNDTVETVLFHMIRGTGIQGLTGIPARRWLSESIEVIRPLLCCKRDEIEQYLDERAISYCVDASNATNDYSRNKLRNVIIPYMKNELNEGVIDHISNMAQQLSEINEFLKRSVKERYTQYVSTTGAEEEPPVSLSLSIVKEDPVIRSAIVREVIERILMDGRKDITSAHVQQVMALLDRQVGKRLNLPRGLMVQKTYDSLLFTCRNEHANIIEREAVSIELDLTQGGTYELNQIGKTLTVRVMDYKKNMIIPKNAYTKWFDYDKIKNTVFIRNRQTGDYLQIREDGSTKKLKNYLIDQKIPRDMRDSLLLLADGDHIMWVIEDRISEAYKVNAQTKKILVISLIGGNRDGHQR